MKNNFINIVLFKKGRDYMNDVSFESVVLSERVSFENFKSNVCHLLKGMGDFNFLRTALLLDIVMKLYQRDWFAETLYMLAMEDYICRKNGIPLYNRYDMLRKMKLNKIIYPSDVYIQYLMTKDETILTDSYNSAIPEFKSFNIVEGEVENVA